MPCSPPPCWIPPITSGISQTGSASFGCCSSLCFSISYAGHRFIYSTRGSPLTFGQCFVTSHRQRNLLYFCWLIPHRSYIQLRTVSWTRTFVEDFTRRSSALMWTLELQALCVRRVYLKNDCSSVCLDISSAGHRFKYSITCSWRGRFLFLSIWKQIREHFRKRN